MGAASSEPVTQQQLHLNSSKNINDERRKKFPKWNNLRKKLSRGKSMFRAFDHGKMLRELTQTWSYKEIVALVDHYKSLIEIKDSASQMNLSRPHVQPLKKDMLDLLQKELCSDVTLVFNGVKFPVHKSILSSRCTFFQDLFLQWDSDNPTEIPVDISVDGISVEMFSTLLQYLYTGDFPAHTSGLDSLDMLMELGEEFGTPNVLEQDLKGLLYNAEHADVLLVFQGLQPPEMKENTTLTETSFEVPCHKAILCARSSFFKSLLLKQELSFPIASDSGCIRLVLDERVFPRQYARVVLQCMYTDSFDLSSVVKWSSEERKGCGLGTHNLLTMAEIAMEVYEVAKFIEFDVLVQGCEDVLQEELSPSSLLGTMEWSEQPHGSAWVSKQAQQYLQDEFLTVAQSDTFHKLPKKYLVKVLQSDYVQACEHDILLSVIRWGESQVAKKMQSTPDTIQDGKRTVKRRDIVNKALKKELAGVINNVRIQHVLPLHSDVLESAIERRLVDRGMPLDIGEGSFYPSCPWMRRRNDKDFVKPRLFLSYNEEAKKILQEYKDTELRLLQQRMLRLGQSIPDTLYMVSETKNCSSNFRKNSSRSITNLGYRSAQRSYSNDIGLYCRSRRSNSLSQAERLFSRSRTRRDFGLPDVASEVLFQDNEEVSSSPDLSHFNKSTYRPAMRALVCSSTSLPLAASQVPDVAAPLSPSSTLSE